MSTELVRRDQDAFELGKVFKASGMFPTMRHEAEAVVKIIAGREFGLGPMASVMGVHMVDGKPTLAANLIAGQIKRHPSYDYKVIRREDTGCTLEFFEGGKSLGNMTWDKKDATAAGLIGKANWKKYPRDMYFARCLTAGARTFCPDVLGGSPIYTAEELGAEDNAYIPAPTHEEEPLMPSIVAAAEKAVAERKGPHPLDIPAPVEDIQDAEVVPTHEAKAIGADVLAQLREAFTASGATDDELCWMLLSIPVDLPGPNPTKAQVGEAMRGLTLEQAFKLEALLKGEDSALPGSGETA